ncbi:hypothetical protein BGZ46_010420 [Entomortierella lignicola]|nr:hypothetical protein BGZ46_010420 [Entomortierella lignicola]
MTFISRSQGFTESQLVNIKEQFNALDRDGDGLIGPSELEQALENTSRNPNDYDTEKFFKDADQNKDGKITFSEFVEACEKLGLANSIPLDGQPTKKSSEEVNEIFRNFDRNNDGSITAEELRETLKSQGDLPSEAEINEMIHAAEKKNKNKIHPEKFTKKI